MILGDGRFPELGDLTVRQVRILLGERGAERGPDDPSPAVPEDERLKCVRLWYYTVEEIAGMPEESLTTSMQLNLPRMQARWA